jgi:hypothetical protein
MNWDRVVKMLPRILVITFTAWAGVACSDDRGSRREAGEAGSVSASVSLVAEIASQTPEGGLLFGFPSSATRLSTGEIVIGDRFGAEIQFVDEAGRLVRTVGRDGSAPGEFRRVSWIGRCGPDSLFVWDGTARRMTVFDARGEYIRAFRIPSEPGSISPPAVLSCSSNGTIAALALPRTMGPPSAESPHYKAVLSQLDSRGQVRSIIGEVPAMELRPLGKVTHIAVSSTRIYVGTAESGVVDVYAVDGRHESPVDIQVPQRRASMGHYEAAIDMQVALLSRSSERDAWKNRLLEIPMPEYLPPYGAVFVDPQERLWVVISAPGDGRTMLRVFTTSGQIIGDLTIPSEVELYEVGRDYLLGSYSDDTGAPYVVMYHYQLTH